MSRLTLSDIAQMLIDQAERDRLERQALTAMMADVFAALTAPRPATAAQEVVLSRSKLADKATGVDVKVVPQNGETIRDAALRASEVFEGLAARYPLPDGAAHAAELGDGLEAWRQTLVIGDGLHSVPDPEAVS